MPVEPVEKQAIIFVDGQNLFHCARSAFARRYPDYDVLKLGHAVCDAKGWVLKQVRFYTGVPSEKQDFQWALFWQKKFLVLNRQRVWTFSRELRYRKQPVRLADGSEIHRLVAEEKGIDVRIAIDIISLAFDKSYDVAVIFSQDQDLSEATDEVRKIARQQDPWIKLACAFPVGPQTRNKRGIDKTDWIRIDQTTYEACVDPADYRSRPSPSVRPDEALVGGGVPEPL